MEIPVQNRHSVHEEETFKNIQIVLPGVTMYDLTLLQGNQ